MDPRHLELLRLFAEYGSLAAVADLTRRSPSAVSQQVRVAERAFGTRLLESAGRGLRLTPAGAVLAQAGADLAVATEKAEAQWDAFRGSPSGLVRVAALTSAGAFLFGPLLAEFESTPVIVELHDIDVAETSYAQLTAEFDIVIAHSLTGPVPAGAEDLRSVPLVREPIDVAMRSDHRLAADQGPLHPADVADEEWIGVPIGYPFDTVLQAIASIAGHELRVAQRLRDNRLVESILTAGERLALLPRFTTPVGASGIVLRKIAGVESERWITALSSPHRAERLAVRTVIEALQRIASDVAAAHAAPAWADADQRQSQPQLPEALRTMKHTSHMP